jgi:hypothetical protein
MSTQEQLDFLKTTYLDIEHIPHAHVMVADKIADAMAETFEVDPELVRTIPHDENGRTKAAVVYVGDGLDTGGLAALHRPLNDDTFTMHIGEGPGTVAIDSRPDMMIPLFKTMVRILQAQAMLDNKEYRPELLAKADSNEMTRSQTLLTGYTIPEEGEEEAAADDPDVYVHLGVVEANGEPKLKLVAPKCMEAIALRTGTRPGVVVRDDLVSRYIQLNPIEGLTL